MTHRSRDHMRAHQAEIESYFEAVLAAFGCNPDGTPKIAPEEFGNPADGRRIDLSESNPSAPRSLNANLPGQMEFFSVKRTGSGLMFEIIVTDE